MKKRTAHLSSLHKIIPQEKFPSLTVDPETLLAFPHGVADKNPDLKWKTRPVLESDLDALYTQILGDPEAMRTFGKDGLPLTRAELDQRFQSWNAVAQQQLARGTFLVTNEQDHCMGHFIVSEMDGLGIQEPGAARIAQAYDLRYAGQGLFTSIFRCFLEQWGAWVYQAGKGLSGRPEITEKFRCFQGERLKKFYTIVMVHNPASWTVVDKLGFQRAKDIETEKKQNVILNYYDPRVTRNDKQAFLQKLHEMVASLDDHLQKNSNFEADKRYLMIDLEGKERTVSYYSESNRFQWHFEYPIG